MITVHFDDCLGCPNAKLEFQDGTTEPQILRGCAERWGEGRLVPHADMLYWKGNPGKSKCNTYKMCRTWRSKRNVGVAKRHSP